MKRNRVMKSNIVYRLVVVWTLAAVWLSASAVFAQEADFDRLANLPMKEGRVNRELTSSFSVSFVLFMRIFLCEQRAHSWL